MNIKKLAISFSAGAIMLGIFATSAFAAPEKLQWRKEVTNKKCDERVGKPVVNVEQKIVGDADSGLGGYWAFDKYVRHIKVWSNGDGTYCALVSYNGKFDAQAGQASPGNTGILDGDEDGRMEGGYRGEITGTLKTSPAWPTRGFVGNFDYQCNLSGVCPGRVSWIDQYFDAGYAFTYEWWGWQYVSPHHGTWINAVSGNSGDIL